MGRWKAHRLNDLELVHIGGALAECAEHMPPHAGEFLRKAAEDRACGGWSATLARVTACYPTHRPHTCAARLLVALSYLAVLSVEPQGGM